MLLSSSCDGLMTLRFVVFGGLHSGHSDYVDGDDAVRGSAMLGAV